MYRRREVCVCDSAGVCGRVPLWVPARVRNPNLHVWSRTRILLSGPVSDVCAVVFRQGRIGREERGLCGASSCRHQVLTSHLAAR